jgi:hypothetical protein
VTPNKKSFGSYWEWQGEMFQKTLSNLSLSNLAKGSRATTSAAVSEDGAAINTEDNAATSASSGPGYWFWRNASMKNLSASNASLTALEKAAKEGDAAQASADSNNTCGDGEGMERRPSSGGFGYWLWRSGSTNKMSFSNASLNTLENKIKGEPSSSPATSSDKNSNVGPITNLQHKLRNSWRKSLQHISNNSLSALDEEDSSNHKKQGWKQSFSERRVSALAKHDDGEEDDDEGAINNNMIRSDSMRSVGSEGAIMF